MSLIRFDLNLCAFCNARIDSYLGHDFIASQVSIMVLLACVVQSENYALDVVVTREEALI